METEKGPPITPPRVDPPPRDGVAEDVVFAEPAWRTAEPAGIDASLRVVLYYDIFHHPLTVEELSALAGGPPTLDARTERHGHHICRAGASADLPGRIERSVAAERMWPKAARMAAIIARFPWVQAVFLTGGLSKRSAPPDGDIDFLLLCEGGRVWSAKTMVELVRRGLPAGGREALCANYLRAADSLLLDDHTVFTAMEIATAVPMYGGALCASFIEANIWARQWVPGYEFAIRRARAAPALPASPVRALADRVPRAWEPRALDAWDKFWNRKYATLDAATRAQRFKRRPDVATNHFEDFQGWVSAEYARRCAAAGIDP